MINLSNSKRRTSTADRNVLRSASSKKSAFTLIELLVVMTLMISLAGVMGLALRSSVTEGRIKRSQTEVLTMGQLLQTRVNEVSLSKLELSFGRDVSLPVGGGQPLFRPVAQINDLFGNVIGGGNPSDAEVYSALERSRMLVLARRDLARMIMPTCRADLLYPPVSIQFRSYVTRSYVRPNQPPGSGLEVVRGWIPNVVQLKPPFQWNRMRALIGLRSAAEADDFYRRTSNNALSPTRDPEVDAIGLFLQGRNQAPGPNPNNVPGPPQNELFTAIVNVKVPDPLPEGNPSDLTDPRNQVKWTREHESAECLYLILATTELYGQTAIDKLPKSAIANTDGDAVPEIVDPWGRPYEFMREPVGAASGAIKNYRPQGQSRIAQFPLDPDPYDFLGADWRYSTALINGVPDQAQFPIYLPPQVVSAGPDGEFGITRSFFIDDSSNEDQDGLNASYCSSAIRWNNSNLAPLYPDLVVGGGATLAYRYPDPFFNVASQAFFGPGPRDQAFPPNDGWPDYAIAGPANGAGIPLGQVDIARQGGGLGSFGLAGGNIGPVDTSEAADNISSLDVGF